MNTKHILALALGVMTMQAAATAQVVVEPSVKTEKTTKTYTISGTSQKANLEVVVVTLSDLKDDWKGDDFSVTVSLDGTKLIIKGKTYRVRDAFGKHAKNACGKDYRKVFEKTIDLPTPVSAKLRGKTKRYHNSSKYFSYYNHNVDTTLTITLPL